MKFAFQLGQRVIAPNSDGRIQGIVVGVHAMIGADNQYIVTALTDEGKTGNIGFTESALLAAQPISQSVKVKRV